MTSFEFNWTSGSTKTQTAGKVFARKRKLITSSTQAPPITSVKERRITSPSDVSDVYVNPKNIVANKPGNSSSKVDIKKTCNTNSESEKIRGIEKRGYVQWNEDKPRSSLFIKRKQKKDRIYNKLQLKSEKTLGLEEKKHSAISTDSSSTVKHQVNTSSAPHSLFSVRHKKIYINSNIPGKSLVERVFSGGNKRFGDLKEIHHHLVSNLTKNGFETLTSVQEKAIPVIEARRNVLVRSQTGSGKTLAYSVPIINSLIQGVMPKLQRSDGVQAVIVVPTRELALQTHEMLSKINTFQWIVVGHLCGGENRKTEKVRLRKGVHILVGTPGRLLDHFMHTKALKIDYVKWLVLDEADRLLDMGFKKDIIRIVEELNNARSVSTSKYDPMLVLKQANNLKGSSVSVNEDDEPCLEDENRGGHKRQTILLSATLNKDIAELADFTMKDHIYIDALEDFDTNLSKSCKIPQKNNDHLIIPNTVAQEFIITYAKHRLFTLAAVLLTFIRTKKKIFIFMATSQMVDYHYELFKNCLVKSETEGGDDDEDEVFYEDLYCSANNIFKLHGSMEQNERKRVFTEFRTAEKGILLCTDVAARGVDIPEADCIIQYTGPQSNDDYLHRVGRTGRAGKSGSTLIFLTHEEQEYVSALQKHKVFLKELDADVILNSLSNAIIPAIDNKEKVASILQDRFEEAVANNKELHRQACFAYSSWSRFYNTYSSQMRTVFNFKNANLGHYVTSFALRETPSTAARVVRGQVVNLASPRRLNKKLATSAENTAREQVGQRARKWNDTKSLSTLEFTNDLEPRRKKGKKTN